MHTTAIENCTHANILPWGECNDCHANAATIEAYRKLNEHKAREEAMTDAERAEAAAAAEAQRIADQSRPLFPWRARNH